MSTRVGLAVIVSALVLATCAPAAPAPQAAPAASRAPARGAPASGAPTNAGAEQLQALVDGARREGELTFMWIEGAAGGGEAVRRWAEGFNKLYGSSLQVRFTPGPAMPEMTSRLIQEYQAGRRAVSDILIGSTSSVVAMLAADGLEPVDWASWAPNVRQPQLITPGNVAVALDSAMPGITYNTQRVAPGAVPRSMQDLLKPEYKGRIASTPYVAGFPDLGTPELWGEQAVLDYMSRSSSS